MFFTCFTYFYTFITFLHILKNFKHFYALYTFLHIFTQLHFYTFTFLHFYIFTFFTFTHLHFNLNIYNYFHFYIYTYTHHTSGMWRSPAALTTAGKHPHSGLFSSHFAHGSHVSSFFKMYVFVFPVCHVFVHVFSPEHHRGHYREGAGKRSR